MAFGFPDNSSQSIFFLFSFKIEIPFGLDDKSDQFIFFLLFLRISIALGFLLH